MSRWASDRLDASILTRVSQEAAKAVKDAGGASRGVSLRKALRAKVRSWEIQDRSQEIQDMVAARGWTAEINMKAGQIVRTAIAQIVDEE